MLFVTFEGVQILQTHMPGRITEITRTSLWRSWKAIRKELKHASVRDVVDFLDYDINPDVWIRRLLKQINAGTYEPDRARRFTLGKSNGFSRTMTLPSIPDLVLYRTIVERVWQRARHSQHRHVYFRRDDINRAQQAAQVQAAQQMQQLGSGSPAASFRSFLNWLKFDQYRKYLLLKKAHPFLVVTDITNFFDSILHSHVSECMYGLGLSPRLVGLLFFLIERLSIMHEYSDSHGVSLPVDEFDCSRTLAHLVLFTHDDAMVRLVGEDAYVRWMDDQNMGVDTKAEGLRVLGEVGRSLARLHLSPHPQKSKVLSLSQARRYFHLDLNGMLDTAEAIAKQPLNARNKRRLAQKTRSIWVEAKPHEGIGEFGKILKRIYRLAGLAGARFLRRRALMDVLEDAEIAVRVCYYMRQSGTASEYLDFIEQLMQHKEQVYADINVVIAESLLRIETTASELPRIRTIIRDFLYGTKSLPGKTDCQAIAPLLMLRFADRRSLPILRRYFDDKNVLAPVALLRASAVVFTSYGPAEFQVVRKSASRLFRNDLSGVVRLIDEIVAYTDVPNRYKARLKLDTEVGGVRKYIDMRTLLTARLLGLCKHRTVNTWLKQWKQNVLQDNVSPYDRRMIRKLL